ncbi:MAG: LytTR family transcriptional regulator [Pedobacter sp.]|nr:MAG: LytTR family transcriptional regulator [Pedobacter sp.]
MKQLLNNNRKLVSFLTSVFWIPLVFFCAQMLYPIRNGSLFFYVFLCINLLLIVWLVDKISKYLTKRVDKKNIFARVLKQCLFGFIVPFTVIILLLLTYESFASDSSAHRIYCKKNVAIIAAFLYVANGFQLVLYVDRQLFEDVVTTEQIAKYNERVLVYNKGSYEPVNLMQIALIYQTNQINWLVTFDDEEHILDLSLREIGDILGAEQFFKINRNQIVNRDAVKRFRTGTFGKIELSLKVNSLKVTVSKDRAKYFRQWFS